MSSPTAPQLFLSYTSVDRERAYAIADMLKKRGITVWVDRRSIPGGAIWSAEVVHAIEGCSVVGVVCSERSMASPNVKQEIQLAWESQRPILPLLLESVRFPDAVRYALAGRQRVELGNRPETAWLPEVLRALTSLGLTAAPTEARTDSAVETQQDIINGSGSRSSDDSETLISDATGWPHIQGFQFKRTLGVGGMAQVFLAWDTELERLVAVKVMSVELSSDEQFCRRFDEEAKIVAKLRHGNIITVFASGEVAQQRYIIMEYISGGTLADRIAKGPLDPIEAVSVAKSIADALKNSHDIGIVHRDVKPGNILFTATDEPILSDFGIAKSLALDHERTSTRMVIGSLKYMAPEQMSAGAVTGKADVYSLGLVLYEMLVGSMSESQSAIVRSGADVRTLEDLLPTQAKFCAVLIGQCLRLEPDERPSAEQCAAELTKLAKHRSVATLTRSRLVLVVSSALLVAVGYAFVHYFHPINLDPFGNVVNRPVEGDSAAMPLVTFDVRPSDAKIFVDGERINSSELRLARGRHQAAVIEKRSFGKLIAVDESNARRYQVSLRALDLPSETEFREFTDLDHDSRVDQMPQDGIKYPPYAALLRLRVDHAKGRQAAFDEQVRDLRALAKYGDPASRLVLFVAVRNELLDDPTNTTVEWVKQASNDGYALATYYYALYYRWSFDRDGGIDPNGLREYRDLMALAVQQGLGFAQNAVREADDALETQASG